ncbi:MAG TPA: hypothetical protein VJQ46_13275 [Gemmatimonadales bacterium]|nr:hypothetical protein [Gemmatimonadales bacterium]
MSPGFGAIVSKNFSFITSFGGAPRSDFAILVGTEGSVADVCAALAPPSQQRGIIVETPSGKIPSHAVSQDAPVRVFAHPGVFSGFCDLAGDPLVASGNVLFNQTVTQFNGPGGGPGSFAIQVTVHGIVDLVTGGQARLMAGARVEIRPDGTLVKDQEVVTLTPI